MRAVKALVVVAIVLASSAGSFAEGPRLEATGPFADPSASDSLKSSLSDKGYRVVLADGTVWCEVWLRKAVPVGAKTDVAGAMYSELIESAVVGVLSFPKGGTDYRGQAVKPGAYTLRYSLHPVDGNHMGISSYRDFLLLVPVALDTEVDARIKYEELMKLSAKSSGSNHPSPISLVAAESKAGTATLTEGDHGHVTLVARVKTSSAADLPISFVVKGIAEQ